MTITEMVANVYADQTTIRDLTRGLKRKKAALFRAILDDMGEDAIAAGAISLNLARVHQIYRERT